MSRIINIGWYWSVPRCTLSMKAFGVLKMARFTKNLIELVINETHCILQWGGDFWTTYSKLVQLHSYVPTTIPAPGHSRSRRQQILSCLDFGGVLSHLLLVDELLHDRPEWSSNCWNLNHKMFKKHASEEPQIWHIIESLKHAEMASDSCSSDSEWHLEAKTSMAGQAALEDDLQEAADQGGFHQLRRMCRSSALFINAACAAKIWPSKTHAESPQLMQWRNFARLSLLLAR